MRPVTVLGDQANNLSIRNVLAQTLVVLAGGSATTRIVRPLISNTVHASCQVHGAFVERSVDGHADLSGRPYPNECKGLQEAPPHCLQVRSIPLSYCRFEYHHVQIPDHILWDAR